ncbi:7017_t:CDS:2 [Ambispora gerdemannii]|uniref:7017_t:CDS:1 n=1 Tax=Ambispora gerdemannii TaxID=144530 RepID=A0A9N8W6H9_9GLOM|nr:7017_t:CDS:2 [Ambispora gerdemannii]
MPNIIFDSLNFIAILSLSLLTLATVIAFAYLILWSLILRDSNFFREIAGLPKLTRRQQFEQEHHIFPTHRRETRNSQKHNDINLNNINHNNINHNNINHDNNEQQQLHDHHQGHNSSSNVQPHRRHSKTTSVSSAKPSKNSRHSSPSHRSSFSYGGSGGVVESVNHTYMPTRRDSVLSTISSQSQKKVDSQGINKKHNKRISNPVGSNQGILTFEEDYIS